MTAAQERPALPDVESFESFESVVRVALHVLIDTPHIRSYLERTDPMALRQAQAALTRPPAPRSRAVPNYDEPIPIELFETEPLDESDAFYDEQP